MQSFESFPIAHAAMVFGCFVPAVMIFCSTFCTVRRNKDPARTAFTYLKYALVTFSLYALFAAASSAFNAAWNILVLDNGDSINVDDDMPINFMIAMGYARPISNVVWMFFELVTDILIMIILLRLCTGILMVHHASIPNEKPYLGKNLRFASYGAALVLLALALTTLGLHIRLLVPMYYGPGDDYVIIMTRATQVSFAFKVFVFVISLGMVAKTVMVKRRVKPDMGMLDGAKTSGHTPSDRNLTWVSNMLIAASVVWLLHTSFAMASFAAWNNLENAREISPLEYQPFYYIFEALFNIWPQFITLVLTYLMGRKKEDGVWMKQEERLPTVNTFGPAYTAP
ncbi:uncharacterized protein FIESC28_03963 [Fusarium coffeatum]|uniref:G-protein coupled receptors family 1 profile domain-containing protein n=1 Tax=Fusarium coffeatum TaxID=231269 RepID=A0A366S1P0_9HYPO|nr:uncharacterized protein FIESC28_03963 [Fusarium coffeatum]RBR23221.1 hypothetical protein FIESC28_03963 [Fusarium coffeatum]